MYYYNQKKYPTISYDNPNTAKKETIDSSGCGVCSAAMVINNLAGKELYSVSAMAKFSLDNKARDNSGTNMFKLLDALCAKHKGFSYKTTGSEDELIKHLQSGGMAIANQGDKYNVFSTSGHFVVAVKMVGNNIEIYDPSMYAGKYDAYSRPKRIIKKTDRGCIVSKTEINKATEDRYSAAYYLVTYKKPAPVKKNKPKITKGQEIKLKARAKLYHYDSAQSGVIKIKDISQYDIDEECILKVGAKVKADKISTKANGNIWIYSAHYKAWICVYNYQNDYSKV